MVDAARRVPDLKQVRCHLRSPHRPKPLTLTLALAVAVALALAVNLAEAGAEVAGQVDAFSERGRRAAGRGVDRGARARDRPARHTATSHAPTPTEDPGDTAR